MIDIKIKKEGFIPKNITRDQAKDTGMAMVLIALLLFYFLQKQIFFGTAMCLLLVNMICPGVYGSVAKYWFGLSALLGTVVSTVILTLIFFGLVTPVGFVRRIAGADALKLKQWKKDSSSVFRVREKKFTSEDIQNPY